MVEFEADSIFCIIEHEGKLKMQPLKKTLTIWSSASIIIRF